MFHEFFTSNGIRVQVLEVSVLIHRSAFVQAYLFLPTGLTLFKIDMTPEEYSKWNADDNYVKHFICSKMPILGVPIDGDGGQIIETATTSQPMYDDSRSVHNEADIQRINALEEQLDVQAAKLKTITDLLFKQGSL